MVIKIIKLVHISYLSNKMVYYSPNHRINNNSTGLNKHGCNNHRRNYWIFIL
jgi:hypothetical protein